jgi:hypothetical protein
MATFSVGLIAGIREHFTDQRKVRPEVITLSPIAGPMDGRGLPAPRIDIDAVPLPSLSQRIATGIMIGPLIEVTIDREWEVFL